LTLRVTCIPLRLPPGTDLRRYLDEYVFAGGSRSGFVVAGIGSLSDPKIRLAAESSELTVSGPVELLTLSGSLSADGAHLHVAVANAEGRVYGGHLCHGSRVRTTVELLLAPVEGFLLARASNPSTGYRELVVHPLSPPLASDDGSRT